MKNLFRRYLLSALLVSCSVVHASQIDLQCEYDVKQPKNETTRKSTSAEESVYSWDLDIFQKNGWVKYRAKDKVAYFSVDPDTHKVTGGVAGDGAYSADQTKADVYPDMITFSIIFRYVDHPNHAHLHEKVIIDRISGAFYGDQYDADPKTDKDVVKYSLYGSCRHIKRIF